MQQLASCYREFQKRTIEFQNRVELAEVDLLLTSPSRHRYDQCLGSEYEVPDEDPLKQKRMYVGVGAGQWQLIFSKKMYRDR